MYTLRAVIYNRCSTEEESQKDALVKQVQESKHCVQEQGWILVDTYIEAKSGTTLKGRSEYARLCRDLEKDKFDIIVIKSQDRLMRNTKDWYLFVDLLQRSGKRLYMYLERKYYTPEDSLITGIKAILAEQYSRELSKKINNAHRHRQKDGIVFTITNSTYGLRKLPDKTVIIDEEEAEMIRIIFQMSADGYGAYVTSRYIYQKGFRNRKGEKISPSVIRKIIRNPLYKGDVVQNRTHYDFDTKRTQKNPRAEWIVHCHAIPAIVDEQLFQDANREMDMRRDRGSRDEIYVKYSKTGKYDLSCKIVCGLCGAAFYRTYRKKKGESLNEWKCSNYLMNGRASKERQKKALRRLQDADNMGCDNVHLDEQKLFQLLDRIRLKSDGSIFDREALLKKTLEVLKRAFINENIYAKRSSLESKHAQLMKYKDVLLEKLLKGIVSDEDFKIKNDAISQELTACSAALDEIEKEIQKNNQMEQRILSIKKRLEEDVIDRAGTVDLLRNIRKIVVYPDTLEIQFDSFAILGLEKSADELSMAVERQTNDLTILRFPQKYGTAYRSRKEEEKEAIVAYMQKEPKITAKKIAERMGVNTSLINRRIKELRMENRIRYSTPNGRGYWIIDQQGPDGEDPQLHRDRQE